MWRETQGGLTKFHRFKWGNPNTQLTLVEWHQPGRPPPACRAQPHCGNYSHFYCANRERGGKTFWLDDVIQELHISYKVESVLRVHIMSYLRICSSNWTFLCVSFNRGTVKRRPAHSCKDKDHHVKTYTLPITIRQEATDCTTIKPTEYLHEVYILYFLLPPLNLCYIRPLCFYLFTVGPIPIHIWSILLNLKAPGRKKETDLRTTHFQNGEVCVPGSIKCVSACDSIIKKGNFARQPVLPVTTFPDTYWFFLCCSYPTLIWHTTFSYKEQELVTQHDY